MAEITRLNKYDTRTNISIDGNVVRRIDTYNIPNVTMEPVRREERRVTKTPQVERRKNTMSLSYALITIALVGVMVFMTFAYVNAQYNARESYTAIAELEQELSELKIENDVQENMIYGNIDYEEIKRIAVEEYGMGVPTKNQIITYERGESEYVKQFDDIPEYK